HKCAGKNMLLIYKGGYPRAIYRDTLILLGFFLSAEFYQAAPDAANTVTLRLLRSLGVTP
ncbi:hypothetical protein, partial [Pantoea sp.]|uniref:hypothetical protein n=1 Tax=Pantoea sp. TaxID=69393 RepID=UPI002579938D